MIGAIFSLLLRRKKPKEIISAPRLLEEIFLDELKGVDLKSRDIREQFSLLTKLFRLYLSKKYRISTLDATTQELVSLLKDQDLDETLIRKSENLFSKADLVKFSGQEATHSELADAYTTVESLLESNMAQARNDSGVQAGKKRKKPRSFRSRKTRKD